MLNYCSGVRMHTPRAGRVEIPQWVEKDPGALREAMLEAALTAPIPALWLAYSMLTEPEPLPVNVIHFRPRGVIPG